MNDPSDLLRQERGFAQAIQAAGTPPSHDAQGWVLPALALGLAWWWL